MKNIRRFAVLGALCLTATLAPARFSDAATFVVKDFESLVAEAEQIFVGTVTGATSRKLAGGTSSPRSICCERWTWPAGSPPPKPKR